MNLASVVSLQMLLDVHEIIFQYRWCVRGLREHRNQNKKKKTCPIFKNTHILV